MALGPAAVQPADLAHLSYRRIGAIDGLPRRWQDDVTPGCRLVGAIRAFLEQRATPEDCAWVLGWIAYYPAAPCWRLPVPGEERQDREQAAAIAGLRWIVAHAPPEPQAIQDLIWACLEVGIDPL